jgi:hypothetical protein
MLSENNNNNNKLKKKNKGGGRKALAPFQKKKKGRLLHDPLPRATIYTRCDFTYDTYSLSRLHVGAL